MKTILLVLSVLLMAMRGSSEENTSATLGVELKNAKAIAGSEPTIALDFVLTNLTDKPIQLARRWNSWGAYQWSFTLADKAGDRFVFGNPQDIWACNFLDVFTIAPKGRHTLKCKLSMRGSLAEGDVAIFHQSTDPEKRKARQTTASKITWQYPVRLVGYFSAPQIHKIIGSDISTNWTGAISSSAIIIKEAGQPAEGKAPEIPQSPQ